MAANEVGIYFKAYDQTQAAMASMTRNMDQMMASGKKLASIFGVSLTFGGTVAGLKEIASKAAEAQGEVLRFNRMMGVQAPQAAADAKELANRYGDAADAVENMMAKGVGVSRELGIEGKAALDTSKQLTELSYKFAHVWGLDPQESFRLMEAGWMGQAKGLRQYGIDVSDAAVKQWALTHGWIEATDVLNPLGESMVRLQIEQEAVNALNAKTKDDLPSLTENWRKFGATIKDDVHPFLVGIADGLNHVLIGMQNAQAEYERGGWWRPYVGKGPASSQSVTIHPNIGPEPSGFKGEHTGAVDWEKLLASRMAAELPQYEVTPDLRAALDLAPLIQQNRLIDEANRKAEAALFEASPTVAPDRSLLTGKPGVPFGPAYNPVDDQSLRDFNAYQKERAKDQEQAAREAERLQKEQVSAERQMTGQMSVYDHDYWVGKAGLIEDEYDRYKTLFGGETDLMQRWHAEQMQELDIEKRKYGSFFDGISAAADEAKLHMKTAGEEGVAAYGILDDALTNYLSHVQEGSKAINQFWTDLAGQYQHQASAALSSYIVSSLPGLFAGVGGLFNGGGNGSGTQSTNPEAANYVYSGRASGGPVSAGQTYWVGEKGKELFTPSVSGAISPAGGTQVIIVQPVNNTGVPLKITAGKSRITPTGVVKEAIIELAVRRDPDIMSLLASGGR